MVTVEVPAERWADMATRETLTERFQAEVCQRCGAAGGHALGCPNHEMGPRAMPSGEELRRARLGSAEFALYGASARLVVFQRHLAQAGAVSEAELLAFDSLLQPALRMAEALLERARG